VNDVINTVKDNTVGAVAKAGTSIVNSVQKVFNETVAANNLSISIKNQFTNLLKLSEDLNTADGKSGTNKGVISYGVSTMLDQNADAFSLAKASLGVWSSKTHSPAIRDNAKDIFESKDPRMMVTSAFIDSFYSTSYKGQPLTFQGADANMKARIFHPDQNGNIGVRPLNSFGQFQISNMDTILSNAKRTLGEKEFNARLQAFAQQLVNMGYGNVDMGSSQIGSSVKAAAAQNPGKKLNNDAARVDAYFDKRGGLDTSLNPLSPRGTRTSFEEPGSPDVIATEPELSLLSDEQQATFRTDPKSAGLAAGLEALLKAPLTHREAFYESSPELEAKKPADVVKFDEARASILADYEASPKSFGDLMTATQRMINLSPGFGELALAYLVANGVPMPDATSPFNFISQIPVSADPMTQAEAVNVLAKLPGSTVTDGVLTNAYMPGGSFAAGLDPVVAGQVADTIAQYDLAPGEDPTNAIVTAFNPGKLPNGQNAPAQTVALALTPGAAPAPDVPPTQLAGEPAPPPVPAPDEAEPTEQEKLLAYWNSPEYMAQQYAEFLTDWNEAKASEQQASGA
jgi:hypothetical protein